MSENIQNLILYPNLHLELNGSECTVNYYYNNIEIPEIDEGKIRIEKFIPPKIFSKQDLFNLLNILNEKSIEQTIEISKRFFGLLKRKIAIPKIKVTTNYSSIENSRILEKLTSASNSKYDPFREWVKYNHGDEYYENKVYENLSFDFGSEVLLFTYKIEPEYTTHWEYETKDGGPDSRYKNNPSYETVSRYLIKLMIPGKLYDDNYYIYEHEYESFMEEIKKLESSAAIKSIKLGVDISVQAGDLLPAKMTLGIKRENQKQSTKSKSASDGELYEMNKKNASANNSAVSGCLSKIIFIVLIVLGIRYCMNKPKTDYTGYAVAQIPLNEYAAIESAPMDKGIGKIQIDTVLKVIETSKKGELTWIKAYKLNSDDTVKETFVCLPEKINIENKNKYVLYNQNSKSWNAYYERVDKRNQPIFEKYKKEFAEAVKSIEVKKGSDNITKESIKDSCWILDRKGYFDLYVAKGDAFYYINKDSKSSFLNAYNKCHSKYETDKIQYFPK